MNQGICASRRVGVLEISRGATLICVADVIVIGIDVVIVKIILSCDRGRTTAIPVRKPRCIR
jgi:hypothetical protein